MRLEKWKKVKQRSTLERVADKFASELYDATVEYALCGTGNQRDFKIENYTEEYRELIMACINGEISSATAIFLRMDTTYQSLVKGNMRDL